MTASLTSTLGSHSLAYSYWCCPVMGVLVYCASSLWQIVSAEEPLLGEQELREDNCRHGFIVRVFLWQLCVCWGFVSAQEENLCMQQKGWTLVADFIFSVYPHTVQTCEYKRQCGVNNALKDSLLLPVTLHANAIWEYCCLNPVVTSYSDVTLCSYIMQWHKYSEVEALLSRKIVPTSKNNA